MDDVAGRVRALGAVHQDQARRGHVERQTEEGDEEQDAGKHRQIERHLDCNATKSRATETAIEAAKSKSSSIGGSGTSINSTMPTRSSGTAAISPVFAGLEIAGALTN